MLAWLLGTQSTDAATDMAVKAKEQNIAVFGESGSGKTVLLSSFFGGTQEPSFVRDSPYKVIADDTGQGTRLRQNYLKMKNTAQAPRHTEFEAASYSFTVKPNDGEDTKASKAHPFSALRLVWHDYPGEWFTEDPTSELLAARRVETFVKLLKSDVASYSSTVRSSSTTRARRKSTSSRCSGASEADLRSSRTTSFQTASRSRCFPASG